MSTPVHQSNETIDSNRMPLIRVSRHTLLLVAAGLLMMPAPGCFISSDTAPRAGERSWTLPDGFELEKVSSPAEVRFPMFAALDNAGRLYVAESSGGNLYEELQDQSRYCRIVVLTDTNGDGKFDHARTFADSLSFPMGITWHHGRVYVADPPYLISLEDTNGDGRADRREVLLEGFGHQTNGSLHGPIVGPDGWLYMTIGWPDGYRLRRHDGTWLEGSTGAIIRCRLDGSDPQVIAIGLENPVEVLWLPTGEMLATNNWHMLPKDGIRDALLHIVEGGVYPRHAEREKNRPLPHIGSDLPAVSLRPAVAHSGMVAYEGTVFPASYRGVFVAEFNTRKVVRYELRRQGSTFRADVEDFLLHADPAFRPSDVLEADDGSLLVVDTGIWYVEHCPTGNIDDTEAPGGIWRVRYTDGSIPDSRGEGIEWGQLAATELAELLADPRPAVRRRAVQEFEMFGRRDAVESLVQLLADEGDSKLAMRSVWLLARLEDPSAPAALRDALKSAEPDIAAASARALGGRGDVASVPNLEKLLGHQQAHVRLASAESLSRLMTDRAATALIEALAVPDIDRMLEHTLAYAIFRSADTATLRHMLNHHSTRVQKAALYLLNDPHHGALEPADLTARAAVEDESLREVALEILLARTEWADHAVTLMTRWAASDTPGEEWQLLAEYARAFAFNESAALLVQRLIGDRESVPLSLRRLLIREMARYVEEEVPLPWRRALAQAIESDAALRREAVESAASLGLADLDEHLAKVLEDDQEEPDIRVRALRGLAERHLNLLARHSGFLLDRLEAEKGVERIRIGQLLAGGHLEQPQLARFISIVSNDSAIDPEVVLEAAERAGDPIPGVLLSYLAERVETGWAPDRQRVIRIAERAQSADREIADMLLEMFDGVSERQERLWQEYEPLLTGGYPERGRELFFGRASCITCHRAEGEGGTGGPDLTRIGLTRSGTSILQSLLFPSVTSAQGYEAWVVRTTDGRSQVGMLDRETSDALILRDLAGQVTRVAQSELESAEPLGRSLMPEGLLGSLDRNEVRDLLAYLQSLE